jgi:hypothetical protein
MRAVTAFLCLSAASGVYAQPAGPSSTGPAPLAGPSVPAEQRATSLVHRDFEGKLQRLETSPEEAALERLSLDEATSERVDKILAERAAILDKVVSGNLELLVEINNAAQSGDKAALLRLAGDVYRQLQPLRDRGTLLAELGRALPADQHRRLQDMVLEYRRALRDDVTAEAAAKGETLKPRQSAGRQALAELGQEIKRSYERQISAGLAELETLLQKLELSPEQDGKVRTLITQHFERTKGKPTPAQKRELFFNLMAVLDGRQKRTLLGLAIQRG